jgi:hypothetical protein
MAQQFLDGPDIVAVLKEVGSERVTQRVWTHRLNEVRPLDGTANRSLQHGFLQVMPSSLARTWIHGNLGCGKHPLPTPLFGRIGIFPV